ncbi:hypothetical protein KUA24_20 [Vibrio phage HNL01]|nr:hypothetical protein KUA24_20 [Vibrio phage HNL01]
MQIGNVAVVYKTEKTIDENGEVLLVCTDLETFEEGTTLQRVFAAQDRAEELNKMYKTAARWYSAEIQ